MADRRTGQSPLALIVFDGRYDRVHYALVLASSAAAVGRTVTLFLTGPAVAALVPEGWRRLEGDPEARDTDFAARGIGTFAELAEGAQAFGVRVIACELALRAAGLGKDELDPAWRAEVAGAVTFLAETEGARTIFV